MFHPYFALRRVWRALSLVAPSLELPAKVRGWEGDEYPFSVRPDHPLALEEVMELHRDAYEGTAFDRTEGYAAGLYASPYRYGDHKWERSITARNISYTWIAQTNEKLPCPIYWLSMNAPAESTYIPLAVAELPAAYLKNDRETYDSGKAWWITQQVTMLTRGYYSALQPEVLQAAHEAEARARQLTAAATSQSADEFRQTLAANAERTMADWQELYGKIMVKHDGDHRVDYAASEKIKGDPVEKY